MRPLSCEPREAPPSSRDGLLEPPPLDQEPRVDAPEPLDRLLDPLLDPECELEPPAVPRLETPPSLRVDAPRPACAVCGTAISNANVPAAIASPLLPLIANLRLPMVFRLLVGHAAHPFPAAP